MKLFDEDGVPNHVPGVKYDGKVFTVLEDGKWVYIPQEILADRLGVDEEVLLEWADALYGPY